MKIKHRLLCLGMTQRSVARQMGRSDCWMSLVCTGAVAAVPTDRRTLCKILRCRVGDVFDKAGYVLPLDRTGANSSAKQ